ncbi:hypothetical protein [Acinetobacter ihumii]|uniref:hypothetical protein n=1 Tax=Acinetobacter ihumii TaxID=2483802 RepID=UPI001031FEA2|nr:hypothetical protein [Acinetobacter ihumii]
MELKNHPSKQPTSTIQIIAYLLLGVPASMCIGNFIAQIFVMNVSGFEGAAGFAWLTFFFIASPVIYVICLILLPILIKKSPQSLATVIGVFGLLTLIFLIMIAAMF